MSTLDALTTDDYTIVGPLGFVLAKDQWLDRLRSGALTTDVLAWQLDSLRRHGDTAIAIGTQHQGARYQGYPVETHLRATHVLQGRETAAHRLIHLTSGARPGSCGDDHFTASRSGSACQFAGNNRGQAVGSGDGRASAGQCPARRLRDENPAH